MDLVEAKKLVIDQINLHQDDLWKIVNILYNNPELAFEEFKSAALITDYLSKAGFDVEQSIGGLKTSFQATKNGIKDTPVIAILCEYDALPEIGHACGHNLIAAAGVGAALGLLSVLDNLPGQVRVIGTPAEEAGGGKRILVDAGVFKNIDAAMMFHPSSKNMVSRKSLASLRLRVEFFGQTAHAAATPQEGINALDAMILTFNNINAMRQHFEIKDRVAGIIKHGGDAANIIPGYTLAEFSIRGETDLRRSQVLEKVIACVEAAALATGCEVKHETFPGYSAIIPNPTLARLMAANLESLGRNVIDPRPNERMGSTDMGNVSQVVPALHPYLETVSEEIASHTIEFRDLCITETGKSAMLDAAKALAMTGVDLLVEPFLLETARAELDSTLNK